MDQPLARHDALPVERMPRLALALLAALGAALATAATAFYRRPFATLRAILRWRLLLSGARERTVMVDSLPIRYFAGGPPDGETIVLVHGLGDSGETWARVFPALARTHRVLAPDLAGFGRVPIPPEGMRFSALSRYFAGFLDALGVERATFVGNSLGGALAIRYAATHPERVARLILLNSVAGMDAPPPYFEPTTRDLARALVEVARGPERRVPAFILDDLIRRAQNPARRAYLTSPEPTDVAADLPRVVAPTAVVYGALDSLVPRATAERIRDAIPGSELLVLPGTGHTPQTEAPRAVIALIRTRLGATNHVTDSSVQIDAIQGHDSGPVALQNCGSKRIMGR